MITAITIYLWENAFPPETRASLGAPTMLVYLGSLLFAVAQDFAIIHFMNHLI